MTDSEKELVNLLRIDAEFLRARGYVFSLEPAADAIERLVKERDEARAERDRDCIALGLEIKALRNDAEAAEAEVARLREALTKIANAHPIFTEQELMQTARAALEAKP